jgi:hypothetical protein
VAHAISARGETPFDIEMGTADATGAAFETSFIGDTDPVLFESIHIGGTKIKAGLVFAAVHAGPVIDDPDMGRFIDTKTVQKKFVFNFSVHFTLLHPFHRILTSFVREIFSLIFLQMSFCF